MTELDPHARQLVERLTDINERISALDTQAAAIKAELRQWLPPGSYTTDGRKAVTVTPNRRFDPTLASRVLPGELLRLCTITRIDAAAAKKVLPPSLYAQCSTEVGEPVIRVA